MNSTLTHCCTLEAVLSAFCERIAAANSTGWNRTVELNAHIDSVTWQRVVAWIEPGVEIGQRLDDKAAAYAGASPVSISLPYFERSSSSGSESSESSSSSSGSSSSEESLAPYDGFIDEIAFPNETVTEENLEQMWNDPPGSSWGKRCQCGMALT